MLCMNVCTFFALLYLSHSVESAQFGSNTVSLSGGGIDGSNAVPNGGSGGSNVVPTEGFDRSNAVPSKLERANWSWMSNYWNYWSWSWQGSDY